MFKIAALSALALVAGIATSAQAQDAGATYYVGAGYGRTTFGNDNLGDGFNALGLSGGVKFNKYIGLEAEAGKGVGDQRFTDDGIHFHAKLDYAASAYVVGSYPVSANTELLGRVGYLKAKVTVKYAGLKGSDEQSGPAYGVGVRYFPNGGNNGVRIDLTHFDFGDDGDGNVAQVAYVRRF